MKNLLMKLYRYFRKLKYSFFSANANVEGRYVSYQPVLCNGLGILRFGANVNFGVINSPLFYSTYAYLEARTRESEINFGTNVHINNGFSAISEKKITIGDDVLIGYNCQITDSNFHDLSKTNRKNTDPIPQEVQIGNNVFIGNNVTILKGVCIGNNCIIAGGAVVTKSFPENVVIGGIPAKIINEL